MRNLIQQLIETALLEKFEAALGSDKLANGTSVAAALVSAIMADLRQSQNEDGAEIIDALDEEAIIKLGDGLHFAIHEGHAQFTLPLGTMIRSDAVGSVRIGREIWVTKTGQPGLFPLEAVRRDTHGSNLELLHDTLSQITHGKPWQRIGLPSPFFVTDTDGRHLLQFPAFIDAGGVVLQRWASDTGAARFCAATPEQIKNFAESIAVDMETLWKRRDDVAAQAKVTRRIADAKIAPDADGVGIHAITVDFEFQREEEHLAFYVEFNGINEAFRPGIVLDYIPALIEGQYQHSVVPWGIDGRRDERDALRALGADGEIDAFAAAIIGCAPEGEVAVLARLAANLETDVVFWTEAGPVYALLFWREGCISVETNIPNKVLQYSDMLELYNCTFDPEIANALLGSSLSSICALPFEVDCTILSATPLYHGGVKLRIQKSQLLVNCNDGVIWER